MPIFNRKTSGNPHASIESIFFDTTRYLFKGEASGRRIWYTPDGDGIGLSFFQVPPDLPRQTKTTAELQEFYSRRIGDGQVKMVEFRLLGTANVASIWMVLGIPQPSRAVTYVGSLTISFAEFSFVIKMQCEERGTTGFREAVLLDKALQTGAVIVDAGGNLKGDLNSDDACHDIQFPNHPLSRLRRDFALIIASLRIQEATQ
jgi:hypothetical protein